MDEYRLWVIPFALNNHLGQILVNEGLQQHFGVYVHIGYVIRLHPKILQDHVRVTVM